MRHGKQHIGCTTPMWVKAATVEAQNAGLSLSKLLAGARTRPYLAARWRAWHRLSMAGCSYLSIGRTTGHDHTSVRNGVMGIEAGREPRPLRPKPIPLITMPEFATEARG